jgi:hypothetical protein
METEELEKTLERLEKTREEDATISFEQGLEDGEKWAREEAEFYELTDLVESRIFPEYIDEWIESAREHLELQYKYFDRDLYLKGFRKGAASIWEQVKDKLKPWGDVVREISEVYD